MLDLDHLGAEPSEELGGERQRLHLLGRQDADALERFAEPGRIAVGDVAEPHGGPLAGVTV